ncbi:collagen alpha-6(VI) chain-like [Physella acuta]|uniref:collagen alpha-6(VI) chain-like n=1 Tax=Physella acuta TaxID=109671 RepID=UPI0027DDEB6A|nr:collagen alpha-6(VI) chain-like [Physella acuta]
MRLIQVLIFCLVARQSSAFLVDLGGVVKDVVNTASNIVSSGVQTVGNVFNTGAQAVATVWCSTVGVLIPCKERPGGSSVAPLPIQCKAVADILFVLDASGSIGSTNFKRQLSFVSNLAASFTLGPNDVRVGEVVFSNSAQKWFHLKDYTDPVALYKAILDTPYTAGATYTDKALNLVADSNMFGTANGGRVNAPDVLVVITDGQSNNPTATAQAAASLRGQGVLIFVVGVGSTFFGLNLFQEDANNELLKLASSPDHVFFSNTYEVLDSVLYQLVQRTCRASGGREQIVESVTQDDVD